MGLDMYLNRKQYVKDWDHTPEEMKKNIKVEVMGTQIKTNKLLYLEFEGMYWRKANHIHRWFVKNVQNGEDECIPHHVPIEKLIELRDLCLYIIKDNEKADELLPTQEGFFFGGTDYDEYYFDSLSETYKTLSNLIKNYPEDEYYYHSSW
jgi:hypothetical protein